ncbi:MAG TPA: IclR family transcriptional regulator [Jiangellaceae bacterium]|nr:IclR family transcriptional regulator [Jiangellaceae bacterium]
MAAPARDRNTVASKILAILQAFTPEVREQSLNQLAQRSGLSLSTTYRLATALVDGGALEPGTHGGYRVGLRLWEIGSLAVRGLTLRDVAVPFMQDLYEATHENVHLAVVSGLEALYVERITGSRSITVKAKEAQRLPLHATGVGKVLLAHADKTLLADVLARGLERHTPHTITDPRQLSRALAGVRRKGFAFGNEEMTLGRVSVAVPILGAQGDVVAALSIVGRSSAIDVARLLPAVRTAGLSISRANGDLRAVASLDVPSRSVRVGPTTRGARKS